MHGCRCTVTLPRTAPLSRHCRMLHCYRRAYHFTCALPLQHSCRATTSAYAPPPATFYPLPPFYTLLLCHCRRAPRAPAYWTTRILRFCSSALRLDSASAISLYFSVVPLFAWHGSPLVAALLYFLLLHLYCRTAVVTRPRDYYVFAACYSPPPLSLPFLHLSTVSLPGWRAITYVTVPLCSSSAPPACVACILPQQAPYPPHRMPPHLTGSHIPLCAGFALHVSLTATTFSFLHLFCSYLSRFCAVVPTHALHLLRLPTAPPRAPSAHS